MRNLNHQMKTMCQHNRDGAFGTQDGRFTTLQQAARDLQTLGYRDLQAQNLKPKHITALVNHWKASHLSTGTIKNRLTFIRWWAEKIGKQNIVLRTNAEYGIGKRTYVTNKSKAHTLTNGQMEKIMNPYTQISLELQQTFGLRREESIKFNPSFADRGDKIVLKSSWTKGGKEREIIIRTPEQRAILDRAHQLVGKESLIPHHMKYVDQLHRFKDQCAKAGIHNVHGLRHHYAQMRYEQLTGWKAPAIGGPTSKQLTSQQKEADRMARMLISRELGHEREAITAVYLGR